MKKNFILAFILLLATVGCSKNGGDDPQDGKITVKEDRNEIQAMARGGSYTIDIQTTCDWQASSDAEWIQVAPSEGGEGDFTITVQIAEFSADDYTASRNAVMTLQSKSGDTSVPISITQYASEDWAPFSLEFGKEGGSKELMIYSPEERPHVEWLGEADGTNPDAVPEWAELIQAGEPVDGVYTYTVNAQENTTGEERIARLQPCFGGSCNMIMVTQKGM